MSKRVFIAVALDSAAQRYLHTKVAHLREQLEAKWVRPENLHLTVSFLGTVDDERIVEICEILEEAVKQTAVFDLQLDQIVWGPNLKNPKMIWVRGPENSKLIELRNIVERTIKGDYQEKRVFRPHLTLARVPRKSFSSEVDLEKIKPKLAISVDRIEIMESFQEGKKRVYRVLKSIPLEF